jgi:signal transduction histidine kinase
MALAVVIVVPSLALSLVSLRLVERLARDGTASLITTTESVPWYNETKINRALAARALHAARAVGLPALADPALCRARLQAAGLDLFSTFEITGAPGLRTTPGRPLIGAGWDEGVALTDEDGRALGVLRYQYTNEGMKAVIRDAYNGLRAPWNDDSLEIFFGGPPGGPSRGFDLHLDISAHGALWERQGRTAEMRAASSLTPGGYSVELSVPWRHLGIVPRPGAALRFDITNDDNDGGGGIRNGQRSWSGHSRNWVDPSALGRLVLGPSDESGPAVAVARRADRPVQVDGRLTEPDWELPYQAEKTEGRSDNRVRFGALWTDDALTIGIDVADTRVVDDRSREDVEWLLRVIAPDGSVLYDSSPSAERVFASQSSGGVQHLVTTGALKGSRLLVAFREGPVGRGVNRWKRSAMALLVVLDLLLGIGLWLVYSTTRHQMRLAELKSDVVATVSHEFKAPLALLQAAAETLSGGRTLPNDKRDRYTSIIERETRRLAALVDNVLSVSRIEAGRKFDFAPTDLAAVVDAALSLYRVRLEDEGFELQLELPRDLPPVAADAGALQEALSNLIDNALKYGGERRFLRVALRDGGSAVTVSVTDKGVGVPAADREKIFERFYRGRRASSEAKGAGLGLSVAHAILRAHGGLIQVESLPDEGSTCTLVLPKTGRPT